MELRFTPEANPGHPGDDGAGRPPVEIGSEGLSLCEGRDGELEVGSEGPPIATLLPHRSRGALAVLVLGRVDGRVLVNGYPPLAVSVLRDRSELMIGRRVVHLSAWSTPVVTAFGDAEASTRCALCHRLLQTGDRILRCSDCGAPRHEGARADGNLPSLHCATYDPRCSRCGALRDAEEAHGGGGEADA